MANTNTLLEPGFAKDPPVKLNVNAKIGGLVAVFGFAGGFQALWGLGIIIGLVADIMAAIGGFRMYQLDRSGKPLVIYGVALALIGAVVGLIGNIVAYSGIYAIGYSAAGAIVGLIIDLIIYFIVYYLVIISRFPGD